MRILAFLFLAQALAGIALAGGTAAQNWQDFSRVQSRENLLLAQNSQNPQFSQHLLTPQNAQNPNAQTSQDILNAAKSAQKSAKISDISAQKPPRLTQNPAQKSATKTKSTPAKTTLNARDFTATIHNGEVAILTTTAQNATLKVREFKAQSAANSNLNAAAKNSAKNITTKNSAAATNSAKSANKSAATTATKPPKTRTLAWLPHPTREGISFAIIAANYRKNNSFELQNEVAANSNLTQNHNENKTITKLTLNFAPKKYPSETLNVAPSKINYPKDTAKRIKREYDEAMEIYANSAPEPIFDAPFIRPMRSKITSHYGNARTYNGALRSFHGGTDFRAAVGTDVVAANRGIVRLAKERFLSGGTVLLDHGGGIYTKYFHLSEVAVAPGQIVERGELIAKSGNTGRSSGPHLHFGVAVRGIDVNPLDFIDKINAIFDDERAAARDFDALAKRNAAGKKANNKRKINAPQNIKTAKKSGEQF